eukprot:12631999-Alexandrium_andersonii.AAC.1
MSGETDLLPSKDSRGLSNMQNNFKRSRLELPGPENDLKFLPRRSHLRGLGVISRAKSDGDDEAGRQ